MRWPVHHLRHLSYLKHVCAVKRLPVDRRYLYIWATLKKQQVASKTILSGELPTRPTALGDVTAMLDPTSASSVDPSTLTRFDRITHLSCGLDHVLLHREGDEQMGSFGSNMYCQLGHVAEDKEHQLVALLDDDADFCVRVKPVARLPSCAAGIRDASAGYYHNVVLLGDGGIWTWGAGFLGRGHQFYDSLPSNLTCFMTQLPEKKRRWWHKQTDPSVPRLRSPAVMFEDMAPLRCFSGAYYSLVQVKPSLSTDDADLDVQVKPSLATENYLDAPRSSEERHPTASRWFFWGSLDPPQPRKPEAGLAWHDYFLPSAKQPLPSASKYLWPTRLALLERLDVQSIACHAYGSFLVQQRPRSADMWLLFKTAALRALSHAAAERPTYPAHYPEATALPPYRVDPVTRDPLPDSRPGAFAPATAALPISGPAWRQHPQDLARRALP